MAPDDSKDNSIDADRNGLGELEPVSKQSLSDAVFEQLRDRIVSGLLAPGSTLPSERKLSDQLGVNRGAVREALKRLEQARLISIQHGGATRVLDFRETAGTDLLAQMLVASDGTIDIDVARGVMEMRTTVGTDVARLCALRAGPEHHRRIDEIAARVEATSTTSPTLGDLRRLQQLSMDFWTELVDGSDNVAYRLAFNSLRETYTQIREMLTEILAEEFTAAEYYRDIALAITEGRDEEARDRARELLSIGEERLLSVLEGLRRSGA
jgi:DNA-binding FadR family transcriptional regulator